MCQNINQFVLLQLGLTLELIKPSKFSKCTRCYQHNVNCKKHPDEKKDPIGPKYNIRRDGMYRFA